MLSCDTSVAVGSATADGSVIFAKNSDRSANECQPLHHAPRRQHPPGATLRTQYLEIPQVAETWELVGSRPYWLWGFEIGVNEWGVAVGNEAVLSKEPYAEPAGLLGMDLIRLGLERATTADEAVAVIGELTERYGQGGSCEAPGRPFRTYHNSYVVADPDGAYVLETAGHRWHAERVRDWAAISNLYTLDATLAWQDPDADLRPRACRLTRARELLGGARREPEGLAPRRNSPSLENPGARGRSPRVQQRAGAITLDDMLSLLRDHDAYGDIPRGEQDLPSICMHVRPGAGGETAAAMVAHLRPDRPKELKATVWTAFGSPCLSVFRPVYPFAVGLPEELDRGGATYDPSSPWWLFERLQRIVARAPDLAAEARTPLAELESRLRQEAAATEDAAAAMLASGDRPGALGALRGLVDASTAQAVDLARRLADQLEPKAERVLVPAMVEAWRELDREAGLPVAQPV